MLAMIRLTLAVVIAFLATLPASAGPGDGGPAALSYSDTSAAAGGMASGGGNLVTQW
jgi:hypothetical protein